MLKIIVSGEYSSSEDKINDFASNGFDPIDNMLSVPKMDIRNGYNKYSLNDHKRNKSRKIVSTRI